MGELTLPVGFTSFLSELQLKQKVRIINKKNSVLIITQFVTGQARLTHNEHGLQLGGHIRTLLKQI